MNGTPGPAGPTVPPRLGHRTALDGMRGVAVLLVVLMHSGAMLWPGAKSWLARCGHLGVHLFFVLSGFLITTLLLEEHARRGAVDLGAFAGRRVRRLLPAAVALLVVLTVAAAVGQRLPMKAVARSAATVLTSTTNLSMMGHALPLLRGPLVDEVLHLWSLAIEVQFYVVWAGGVWVATRLGWSARRLAAITVVMVAVVAVARAVVFAGGTNYFYLYFSTWSRLDAPLAGALVGIAFTAGWLARPTRALVAVGVAGFAAVVVAAFVGDWTDASLPLGLYTVLAAGAAAAIAAVVAAPGSALARGLSSRPLMLLGTISYSLYVWHYGLFFVIERRDPSWPGPARMAVGVAVSIAVAAASHRWVERPFLVRRRPVTVEVRAPNDLDSGAGEPAPSAR